MNTKCTLLFAIVLFAISTQLQAGDDEFEDFRTFSIYPAGLLSISGSGTGVSFGGLGVSMLWNHVLFEVSGIKFAKWKEKKIWGTNGEFNYVSEGPALIEIASIDIGFQYTFMERYNLAIVPYSWTWSTGTDGFAILGKSWINDNILIQAKVVPIAYFKNFGKKWYDNNSYIGVDFYLKNNLIGIRHNRAGGYNSTNLALTYFID